VLGGTESIILEIEIEIEIAKQNYIWSLILKVLEFVGPSASLLT
jgi:hypothetical protein